MIKTYLIPTMRQYMTWFKDGKKKTFIEFRSRGANLSGCVFTTSKKELQDAIEASKEFHYGIIVLQSSTEKEHVVSKPTNIDKSEWTTYKRVKSVQGAANILINNYGVDPRNCGCRSAILERADELHVWFPQLETEEGGE